MTDQQFSCYNKLEDVLEDQYVCIGKTTRATQTDWKWRAMAERWGHGRCIVPSAFAAFSEDTEDQNRMEKIKWFKDVEDINEIRKTRACDKMTGTSDLEFDPYDPALQRKGTRPTPAGSKCLFALPNQRDTEPAAVDSSVSKFGTSPHLLTPLLTPNKITDSRTPDTDESSSDYEPDI